MECDCAPPSDQLPYRYCVPVAPACGVAVTPIVWLAPAAHWNVQGAVQALPSTVSDNPAGEDVTVTPAVEVLKFAVTAAGAFMVRFCGVVVPLIAPLKPVNWKPLLA